MRYITIFGGLFLTLFGCCFPDNQIALYRATDTGPGEQIGIVLLTDTDQGLLCRVSVENLPPGPHDFHIHENPSCQVLIKPDGTIQQAGQAGNHYDSQKIYRYTGPNTGEYTGGLPILMADKNGFAQARFYIEGLTARDLGNRSFVIYAGKDDYQNAPIPLNGGGDRIACGIIRMSE
ncbi:MAG: superoxide dismutase family protein [Alphaproteobacteria bacterium]|nr:superoxide dismutase family protein [Alphaproteobacteria bacterium]